VNIIAVSNNLYDFTGLLHKDGYAYLREKKDLTVDSLLQHKPEYVFFPHWSYIIPKDVYERFTCIIFHMTDLPFGRGGSPLQNLIERKIYHTKISAIKCTKELDAGDVYLKREFDIPEGSAGELYLKAAKIISVMIDEIVNTKPVPVPQTGEVVEFKRRTSKQSDISKANDLDTVYDFIRMLDAPGYPNAFIKTDSIKYDFRNVKREENFLFASVKIYMEEQHE
jgi:methionyl-tRNA formyltransferase